MMTVLAGKTALVIGYTISKAALESMAPSPANELGTYLGPIAPAGAEPSPPGNFGSRRNVALLRSWHD